MTHKYYYKSLIRVYNFLIPKRKSVLYCGFLKEKDFQNSPLQNISFIDLETSTEILPQKYDYIILDSTLGKSKDIPKLLFSLAKISQANTKIIIHQENHLWQPILKLAARLKLKNKENPNNWLSLNDTISFLNAAGYDVTKSFKKNILPVNPFFIGEIINHVFVVLPILDFLKLDQFIICRYKLHEAPKQEESLSICLTVRDEEKNIEPIVKSIPTICAHQEIIFIEGHSKDNTVSEIKKCIQNYPEKNIRLVYQPGKGQGDAIKIGFHEANGDIIILYEGDGTSEPNDIQHFYYAIKNNQLEFIEGSRFIYPLSSKTMPFINKLGNMFFAGWFSFFIKQNTTDVLSGIKAIRKTDYENIYHTWGFLGIEDPFGDFELLYGSSRYGLKIGEIPIHYKPRDYGTSKTKAFKHGYYLLKMAIKGYLIFRKSKTL